MEAKDRKAVVVEEIVKGGNAEQSGQVKVGDVVSKYAACFFTHNFCCGCGELQMRTGTCLTTICAPTGAVQQS